MTELKPVADFFDLVMSRPDEVTRGKSSSMTGEAVVTLALLSPFDFDFDVLDFSDVSFFEALAAPLVDFFARGSEEKSDTD